MAMISGVRAVPAADGLGMPGPRRGSWGILVPRSVPRSGGGTVALPPRPGVALCESVLDALAVDRYPWGAPDGEAVIAGAGTSGL